MTLPRTWSDGDVLELYLPMHVFTTRWYENSVAVERGPLVYALKIEENWTWTGNNDKFGNYFEVRPESTWNYGLQFQASLNPEKGFHIIHHENADYPWNLNNAPLEIRVKAKAIPEWTLYNTMAGPLPHSGPQLHLVNNPWEEISLVPYGCTTLRITEFPLVE